jgi:hypothetical protein
MSYFQSVMYLWALENFLKQHAHLASCAHEPAECYLLQAICVWHTSDVHKLHCAHPCNTIFNVGVISSKLEMMWQIVTVV